MNSLHNLGKLIQQSSINRVGLTFNTFLMCVILLTSCIEDKTEPLFAGSIKGIIESKQLKLPIKDVEINTSPVTSVTFTDNEGKFIIDNVQEGDYSILTNIEGYKRESFKVKVIKNITTEISIKLSATNIIAPSPQSPIPNNGETKQPLKIILKWSVTNSPFDSLQYAIKIYEANQVMPLIETKHLKDTLYTVENLKFNTTYYWQVDVESSTGHVTSGDIWLFKTIPFPDNRIVFTSKKTGDYELYSSNITGDSLARITTTSSYELKPLYSSNREKIAFASNSNIDYQIYVMNKDGSGRQQVTTIPIAGYHNQGIGFNWSPDNGKFIYSNYNKLYRIDKDGVNLTLIATAPINRNFRACDWTAVGNKIVVETISSSPYDSEIYLMNADGSDTTRVVDNLPGVIESPSFSVDGKEILFTRDVSGFESENGRQLDARIFIINIVTFNLKELSGDKPTGTNDLQPSFSPDGSRIIFTNASNDGTGVKSIWIMDKDGSNRKKVVDNAEMPNWQ